MDTNADEFVTYVDEDDIKNNWKKWCQKRVGENDAKNREVGSFAVQSWAQFVPYTSKILVPWRVWDIDP